MHRATLIGPLACSLIGGGAGVCLAMLYRQEPLERAHVYLDDSLPFFLGGVLGGLLVGVWIHAICLQWPSAMPWLSVPVMTLLGAAILAPVGWIAGDTAVERASREGMLWGALMGAAGGLAAGVVQFLTDRRSRRAVEVGAMLPRSVCNESIEFSPASNTPTSRACSMPGPPATGFRIS